jgi:hypothetical protein
MSRCTAAFSFAVLLADGDGDGVGLACGLGVDDAGVGLAGLMECAGPALAARRDLAVADGLRLAPTLPLLSLFPADRPAMGRPDPSAETPPGAMVLK